MIAGALLLVGVASAQNSQGQNGNSQGQNQGGVISAPELDPSTAGVVAAILVGGGVLVVRRRRSRDSAR